MNENKTISGLRVGESIEIDGCSVMKVTNWGARTIYGWERCIPRYAYHVIAGDDSTFESTSAEKVKRFIARHKA